MNYYERAQELNEETIANRRYFHTNAEVGLDMPKAKAYVMKKLTIFVLSLVLALSKRYFFKRC